MDTRIHLSTHSLRSLTIANKMVAMTGFAFWRNQRRYRNSLMCRA